MRRTLLICGAIVLATVLFRLPMLLHARDVNGDAALIALQAMHMIHGEWSWRLWTNGYQSSLDSALTAAAFAVFGPSPLVLMIVPLVGQIVVALLAYAVLRKRMPGWASLLAITVLVLAPPPLQVPLTTANRQWCIVLVFLSIWLLDGASEAKRPLLWYALGSLCAAITVFVDLYAVLFVPGLAALGLMCCFDGAPARSMWMRRAGACAIGLVLGASIFLLSRMDSNATTGQAGLTLDQASFNSSLLLRECIPYSLGYGRFDEGQIRYRGTVTMRPMPWALLLMIGGWSLVPLVVTGAVLAGSKKLDWRAKRLGLFGFIVCASTIGGFVLSVMPVDMWSERYLAPIFWAVPFALVPLAGWLGQRAFALAVTPLLLTAAIAGWLGYGPWTSPQAEHEEAQLIDALRSQGIRYASADFWLAYRLTFLAREDPIVVPIEQNEDYYEPYRRAFLAERVSGLIFHPRWSRQPLEPFERYLLTQKIPFRTVHVGDFTVLIADRTSATSGGH